ncbi:uncharacterized protein LOC144158348 isoform X2 [Haemaphysalis longicornis]
MRLAAAAAEEAPLHRHQPPPRNIMMHEGCVMAMSTDAVHGCGVSCSQEIQATIPTSAISTQCALLLLLKSASSQTEEDFSGTAADAVPHTCTCWPNSGDSRSFLLTPVERLGDGEGTALTAGILWATSSTPERCVTAMSVGVASGQVVSCSQKTQATVTTSARGTQCAPKLFISASSQTERKFPDPRSPCAPWQPGQGVPAGAARVQGIYHLLQQGQMCLMREWQCVHSCCSMGLPPLAHHSWSMWPSCALEQFSASGDGAEVAAEGGLRTCSCHPCSGNKGNFCTDGKKLLFGGKLYSCLSCGQSNHQTNPGERCATMMLHICTICKKAFRKKCSLGTHMRMHSGKDSDMCSTSNEQFTYRTTLVIHESAHSNESSYVCSICQEVFAQKANLVAHERLHFGKKPYVCDICRKSFTFRRFLLKHEKLHSTESPYACSICHKGFLKSGQLARHEKLHSAKRCYVCSTCSKAFTSRSHLVVHERLHSGERPYTCGICKEVFNTSSQLASHERLHSTEKPYVCSICKSGFNTSSQLACHERMHSNEKPYVCKICQKSFKKKCNLIDHEIFRCCKSPYVCNICQKTFRNKSHLTGHKRVHSGERPYVCSFCQQSFSQKHSLVRHEKVHSGERPYVCSICPKSFFDKSNLTTHEKVHSGEKTYMCRFCPNTFSEKAVLERHEILHPANICQSSFADRQPLKTCGKMHTSKTPTS